MRGLSVQWALRMGFRRIAFLFFLMLPLSICGQSILSEYAQNTNFPVQERLSTEKILKISNSRKIFIMSFNNKGFSLGDFITLIHQDQHVARAIVAKTKDERVGIKIIKIYSIPLWNQLQKGLEIKVLRGDDSYFVRKKKKNKEKTEDGLSQDIAQIVTNDDLFNDKTFLKEDIDSDERKKSFIKTDNLINASTGFVNTVDLDGEATRDTHFSFTWGHQLFPNLWGELAYGFSNLKGFPDKNIVTALHIFTVRMKYTIRAPFYSFINPYLGYQVTAAQAPASDIGKDEKTPEEQKALLSEIQRAGLAAGVTVLIRMVPGWFARIDMGTDIMGIGMTLEF